MARRRFFVDEVRGGRRADLARGNTQAAGEDDANARHLASRIAEIPGVRLDPSRVQTNIVVFDIAQTGLTSPELSKLLRDP